MKTISIDLYEFDELSSEAQQKAINDFRNSILSDGDIIPFFSEDAESLIIENGFENPEVQYSLGYSQGDGFSFSATGYNKILDLFKKHLGEGKEKTAKIILEYCELSITGNKGRYCFANKWDIDLIVVSAQNELLNVDELVKNVKEDLQSIYLAICKKLEQYGYNQIEYEQSDDCITERIRSNNWDFTENGKFH